MKKATATVTSNQQPVWMREEKFEMSFTHKLRIFRNLRMEKDNSYCASPGTVLKFERMKIDDNHNILFRVRRTGRNTFYTTSEQILLDEVAECHIIINESNDISDITDITSTPKDPSKLTPQDRLEMQLAKEAEEEAKAAMQVEDEE